MAAIPRLRMAATTVAFGAVGIIGFQYFGDAQAGIYRGIMHYLHKLDPEDAHYYSIQAAKYGLVPRAKTVDSPCLSVSVPDFK